MTIRRRTDIFVKLGECLERFGHTIDTEKVIAEAVKENPWFSRADIIYAVDAIREQMLGREKIENWLSAYDPEHIRPKNVGIIMAGNIPLVGFADMMYVLMCGCNCYVKPSTKDRVLTYYIISLLKGIDAEVPLFKFEQDRKYDAVIATGSDNSNIHFRSRFADVLTLLRGTRHSLAVIQEGESDDELSGLEKDIFTYNGMGCRNVSLLFVPRGLDVSRLGRIIAPAEVNEKYLNNYIQTRAMMSIRGEGFVDCGSFLMTPGREFPDVISCVNYTFYDSVREVEEWVEVNENHIQCVVSHSGEYLRGARFGYAQFPSLSDYPDGKDVVDFLANL